MITLLALQPDFVQAVPFEEIVATRLLAIVEIGQFAR
jgi:hypothetical protein